jgi:hypothetical protein
MERDKKRGGFPFGFARLFFFFLLTTHKHTNRQIITSASSKAPDP